MKRNPGSKSSGEEDDLEKNKVVEDTIGTEIFIARKPKNKKKEGEDIKSFSHDNSLTVIWNNHGLAPPTVIQGGNEVEANMDEVQFVTGIERDVRTPSPLIITMDTVPFNADEFRSHLHRIGLEGLEKESLETIKSVTVCYAVGENSDDEPASEIERDIVEEVTWMWGRDFAGWRNKISPLYHAVETGNVEAVRELLNFGVDVATQGQSSALLSASHLSNKQLKDAGYQFEEETKKLDPTLEHEKKQKALAELSSRLAPSWESGECVWEDEPSTVTITAVAGTQDVSANDASTKQNADAADAKKASDAYVPMNPFQLSFFLQHAETFAVFLEFERITSMTGHLELKTERAPWPANAGHWPDSFKLLQNLTSLRVCDPKSRGPVPSVILQLTQLVSLDLSGSGYTKIPEAIVQLAPSLEMLNVSKLKISKLPVVLMSKMRKLKRVDCSEIKLASPPSEIVKQGPEAVARYILDLEDGAAENTDVLLMMIGDGEAGKTSTLLSLKNTETNTARPIGVDDRTIGIDISEFVPFPEVPLRFSAWDFGGQAVYAIMQQLFMSRRALYPLLWRVRESLDISRFDPFIKCDVCKKPLVAPKGRSDSQQPVYRVKGQGLCHAKCASYENLIMSWTERLQFRVPGVTVVLIATHIDCATPEQVEEQCATVAAVAQKIVARQAAMEGGIPQLKIHNNGQSFRVNNVTGEGVLYLREQLRSIAENLDFYGEVIPASYARLRRKLREMQQRGEDSWRTWITWSNYQEIGKECGINSDEALNVATRFFHDTGELRYFGDATQEENKAAKERGQSEVRTAHQLLGETVFPNPFWIVDVLRGLIRHEHNAVLQLIETNKELTSKHAKVLRRRVHRLMQRGLLHKTLLPFIWNGVAGMSPEPAVNEDEFRRLIALLQAFDILMDRPGEEVGAEWVVPSLSAGRNSRTIDASAFVDDGLPFVCRLIYDALPPFFDMMLVAHVMNSGLADSVDFIEGAASFRKFGDKALLFAGLSKVTNPRTVFRQDQLHEELLQKVLREDQCHVVVATTSRRLLKQLLKEVGMLEEFFPGLRRLAALFPCHSCRLKRQRFLEDLQKQANELGDGTTADMLFAKGQEELELAELADIEEAKYLEPVVGNADDPRCDRYHEHENRPFLSEAFRKIEPRIQRLVNLGRWFVDGGDMNQPYNNGRRWGVPRYYEEVMMIMREVMKIMKPTPEQEEEQKLNPLYILAQCEITDATNAVESRQLLLSAQLEAGALPTLRTVSKFCAKKINTLTLAWAVNERLEKFYGPLSLLLECADRNRVNCASKLWSSKLVEREQRVPELIFALKTVDEWLTPHLVLYNKNPQFPSSDDASGGSEFTEMYEKFMSDNSEKLQVLQKEYPELKYTPPTHYLSEAYGQSSQDTLRFHLEILLAVTKLLDEQELSSENEAQLHQAVADNNANIMELVEHKEELDKEPNPRPFITFIDNRCETFSTLRDNIRSNGFDDVTGDSAVEATTPAAEADADADMEAAAVRRKEVLGQRRWYEHRYFLMLANAAMASCIQENCDALLEELKADDVDIAAAALAAMSIAPPAVGEIAAVESSTTATTTTGDDGGVDGASGTAGASAPSPEHWIIAALDRYMSTVQVRLLPCVDMILKSASFAGEWNTTYEYLSSESALGATAKNAECMNMVKQVAAVLEQVLQSDAVLSEQLSSLETQLNTANGKIFDLLKTRTASTSLSSSMQSDNAAADVTPAVAVEDGPIFCSIAQLKKYYTEHSANLAAVWQAVPELQGVLSLMPRGYREEGALFLSMGVRNSSRIFEASKPCSMAFRAAALSMYKYIINLLECADVNVEDVIAASAEKKAALEAKLSEVEFPENLRMQDAFYEMCDSDPACSSLVDNYFSSYDDTSDEFNRLWDKLDSLGYETCYREVVFLIRFSKQNSLSKEDSLAMFKQRCDDLIEVNSTDAAVRGKRVEAIKDDVKRLLESLQPLLNDRQPLSETLRAAYTELLEKAKDPAQAVLDVLTKRFDDFSANWRGKIDAINAATEKRLTISDACKDQKKAAMFYQAQSIRPKLELVLNASKAQALEDGQARDKLIQELRAGEVGKSIDEMITAAEKAVEDYEAFGLAKTGVKKKLLGAVADRAEQRTAKYTTLQKLRSEYAPVWYFGGGERAYSDRVAQKWDIDWEKFIDMENPADVCRACPAEPTEFMGQYKGFAHLSVQPAEPYVVFVSHSQHELAMAKLVMKAINESGIEVRCGCSGDFKEEEDRLNAIKKSKVLISCMDANYATTEERQVEYTLASSLKMEIIPVLVSDYQIKVMSSWWPIEMPFLEQHSLFVDLRVADANNMESERAIVMCTTVLVPTIRKLLQEWSPPVVSSSSDIAPEQFVKRSQSTQYESNSNNNNNNSSNGNSNSVDVDTSLSHAVPTAGDEDAPATPQANADVDADAEESAPAALTQPPPPQHQQQQFEAQFIACEKCALEGDRHAYFDRSLCRELHETWKKDELARRSAQPDAPSIPICPLLTQCSGEGKHDCPVSDVLAAKVQQMTIPCPRCLSKGILPPFCFQREVCLTELEDNRGGSMLCKRCADNVPLFDLLRSEVFISYNWGSPVCPKCTKSYFSVQYVSKLTGICQRCEGTFTRDQSFNSNQMLVSEMKERIEEEAGVTCWQDLDRLVGGKDLVKEMEAGVQQAEVVVVFLTDSYVKSVNCMKEYLFATKHGKFIIPVVLKDYRGSDVLIDHVDLLAAEEGGGGGEMGALGVVALEDMPKWWDDSMSSLSQFKPILLLDETEYEDVLFEISERIQSRFHRAQRFATADDVVGYLRDYTSWSDTRKVFLADHAYMLERHEVEVYLKELFDQIDLDADGLLGEDELAAFLDKTASQTVFTKEQITGLISEADVDCDGMLTLDEFKLAMVSVLEEEKQQRSATAAAAEAEANDGAVQAAVAT